MKNLQETRLRQRGPRWQGLLFPTVDLHDLDHSFAETLLSQRHPLAPVLPSKYEVEGFVDEVMALFFPQRAADVRAPEDEVRARLTLLRADLERVLCTVVPDERSTQLAGRFSALLPGIYGMLRADAAAIAVHRLAHGLHTLDVPLLPRLLSEVAHGRTGVDIHPGAQVGLSFCIDHGTGIVIGETAVIGDEVKIYQGVTLGALSVSKSEAGQKRHPTIEDRVVIYANATVLGGTTTVGHDSVIGGNVWLTTSVAPRSYVYHSSQVRVRSVAETLEPLDYSI